QAGFSGASFAEVNLNSVPSIINLNKDIVIEGDIVYLDDIFSGINTEDRTAIARSPALRKDVELSARWLWARAQKNELYWH
ncbi:hypothetical protein, partial [Marinomonas aquimarina]|uniref:hypothetical protein n=1 Tax=Marinomonas aquimarina TaxID=295068 RepID=UPI000A41FDED